MNSPLISIIMPFYNVEEYVAEALDSCINQTYRNIEIICIDDKGGDGSRQIVDEYVKKDKRVSVVEHDYNRGLGAARNTGIEKASGYYVLFLDSDDFYESGFFEEIINFSHKSLNPDVIDFGFNVYNNGKKRPAEWTIKKTGVYQRKSYNFMISTSAWSKLWKLSFIKQNNLLFSKNIVNEEMVFVITSYLLLDTVIHFNIQGINWRYNNQSISRSLCHKSVSRRMFDLIKSSDLLKYDLIKRKIYNEKEYMAIFITMIAWLLHEKKTFLNPRYKLFYRMVKKIIKGVKMTKDDFKTYNLENSYSIYRNILKYPSWFFKLIRFKKAS